MTEIILTSDQTQQLAGATDGVVIADAAGNVVASLPPKISEEEEAIIAEAKRRLASDQPTYPSSEVLQRLHDRENGIADSREPTARRTLPQGERWRLITSRPIKR